MKCESCPFLTMEGVQTDLSWCKLYSAEAPVKGCEGERDTLISQREIMENIFNKEQKEE
jgi:hypothetical protein